MFFISASHFISLLCGFHGEPIFFKDSGNHSLGSWFTLGEPAIAKTTPFAPAPPLPWGLHAGSWSCRILLGCVSEAADKVPAADNDSDFNTVQTNRYNSSSVLDRLPVFPLLFPPPGSLSVFMNDLTFIRHQLLSKHTHNKSLTPSVVHFFGFINCSRQ